jgi:alginate O-acetyltransferase complex protein AlgI
MIFNTFAYFILFLVPAAILFRHVRTALQPWVCLLFGAGFFVFFSIKQAGGAAGAVCLLIFIWEAIFSRFYKKGSWLCFVGIAQTILFLVVFKYWNFLTGLVLGPKNNVLFWPGAFLPLGISFFTFEFIHYAVDRYRGTAPAGKFGEYMSFILFFPTMVAGPIKRYQDFLPALREPSLEWAADWEIGTTRVLAGLAKKFALADFLTAFTNHLNRNDIASAQRWVLPIWLLAYGMKIYFDFSAYSDIAIGSARLFGIRVKENFDWPYIRTNISDFWKHWHMSLYRWLVDYIFIPLGGSRCRPPRVIVNLLLTMMLSGLWHGAGLNFIAWGLWHGLLLSVRWVWVRLRAAARIPDTGLAGAVGAWTITFITVNLGWAFFCMNLPTAMFFLKRLFIG